MEDTCFERYISRGTYLHVKVSEIWNRPRGRVTRCALHERGVGWYDAAMYNVLANNPELSSMMLLRVSFGSETGDLISM